MRTVVPMVLGAYTREKAVAFCTVEDRPSLQKLRVFPQQLQRFNQGPYTPLVVTVLSLRA